MDGTQDDWVFEYGDHLSPADAVSVDAGIDAVEDAASDAEVDEIASFGSGSDGEAV